jgi:biopolymer transport protein ExbD
MISFRKKTDQSAEVFTSAMNDIMFFLMLFFIIISTLLNPSMINVTLPKTASPVSVHSKEIKITVTKEMNYYVNNDPVKYEDLENQLRAQVGMHKDAIVVLRMDNSLSIQNLVNVLSMGTRLNVKMTIATGKE